MRTFKHAVPVWNCRCNVPGYSWSGISENRLELSLNMECLSGLQKDIKSTYKEAIQLNYPYPEPRASSSICSGCERYKWRIIPNPYYKEEGV